MQVNDEKCQPWFFSEICCCALCYFVTRYIAHSEATDGMSSVVEPIIRDLPNSVVCALDLVENFEDASKGEVA